MATTKITPDSSKVAEAVFAEKAVLGTMITEPEAFTLIVGKTDPDNFYDPRHRSMFFKILEQHNDDLPIDPISIYDRMAPMPFDVLADICLHAMPGSVEFWIDKINAAAARRRAQVILQEAMNSLDKFDTDLVANFKNMSDEVVQLVAPKSPVANMNSGMIETLKKIEHRQKQSIVRTGIAALDMFVGGFRPGQFWVIAGRTSMGKSSTAQNIILSIAETGHSAGYISIEGNNDDFRQRLLSIKSEVPINAISSGNLAETDYARIAAVSGRLSSLPIAHVDKENLWNRVKAKIQLLKFQDPKLSVVFVDYLGLIHNPNYRNRWEAIGAVTADMKLLAESLELAIVAVVQINRETEKRRDHRPTLADIRDAGSIEQDADVILLLYRPHYYDKKADPYLCEIGIAKQRNGPTGCINTGFNPECVKFFDR